jgi:hypothetical protein
MCARSRLRAARCVESAPSLMKKDPDQNSADSAEIEALITRLERGQLRDGDAQLLARLLRLLLRLITLLQQKNASLSRLKRLLLDLWLAGKRGNISERTHSDYSYTIWDNGQIL